MKGKHWPELNIKIYRQHTVDHWVFTAQPLIGCWASAVTSALHDVMYGSVTDGCITWLDVQKWFVSYPHRHHLLQTQLWQTGETNSQSDREVEQSVSQRHRQLDKDRLVSLPLFLVAWAHRILAMSAVHVLLTPSVAACKMNVWLLDLLLLNQISKHSPLSPVDSVRPTSAVCGKIRELSESCRSPTPHPEWVKTQFYLEWLFVDEDIQPTLHLLGFAEKNKLLEKEDMTLTPPPACPDSELVLSDQLTLLLQVHLQGGGANYWFHICLKTLTQPHVCLCIHNNTSVHTKLSTWP